MIRLQPEVVLKRAEKAEDRKDEWRSIYEDCYTYALPQRNLYGHYEGGGRGQSKMDNVFDSTAINSTQRFANRLQSAIFPPYRNWCSLQSGTDVPVEQIDGLNRALDLYTDKMFEVIRQTNFDLAMSEFLLDLAVGTGVMLIQGGDDVTPIRFEAVPPFLVALEQGPHGKIDNVYRKIRIKGEAIQQQWSDAKIPEPLAEKIKTKPTDDIDLLEATIYIPEDDYWCYHIIWPQQKSELVYRVLESSPWIIARYIVCAGEIWGRGPLLSALPDIKTINHTKKMLLQNASIAISGMYTAADDGVLNPSTIRIQPGAIIPVARNGGPQGASLAPLPRSGDFNLAQIVINDLSMGIKKIMLDDTLPPDSASARSATEINSRMAELAQNLGSAFGRLLTEALIPITSRILRVMDEQNIIDMPMRVDGREIKVVPISPLARAQAQEDLNSVMQFMQLAGGMGPNGMLSINQDELIAFVADRLGVPQKILNSPEQKAEMMLMAKQQMEQMAQQSQGGPAIAAPQ
mgnify:CR=1 FL=1